MNILLTHPSFQRQGGVQTFSRQLACELGAMGHNVRGFEDLGGRSPSESEPLFFRHVHGMESDPFIPDIIHGHHQLPTLAALMAYPGVPAIFHCHGGTWRDLPIRHPRIYHYLAMSRSLLWRMQAEFNLPQNTVTLFFNSVDCKQFKPGRPLGKNPANALVYHSRLPADAPAIAAIRDVAQRRGLSLECVGIPFGKVITDPETLIPLHDVVFASGISALEAMACGRAVIILGNRHCGEMITSDNFDRLSEFNFSVAANSTPTTVETIGIELDRYDPGDAAKVSSHVRAKWNIGARMETLIGLYQRAIIQHSETPPNPHGESCATARILRGITPLVHASETIPDGRSLPAGALP